MHFSFDFFLGSKKLLRSRFSLKSKLLEQLGENSPQRCFTRQQTAMVSFLILIFRQLFTLFSTQSKSKQNVNTRVFLVDRRKVSLRQRDAEQTKRTSVCIPIRRSTNQQLLKRPLKLQKKGLLLQKGCEESFNCRQRRASASQSLSRLESRYQRESPEYCQSVLPKNARKRQSKF